MTLRIESEIGRLSAVLVHALRDVGDRLGVDGLDLAEEPFLLPGHSLNTSNLLMDACRRAGFEPKVPYRANYLELSKALVRQGLGIALLPKMFVAPGTIEGLVTIPLREPVTRDLDLIYSNERPLAVAARLPMRKHRC